MKYDEPSNSDIDKNIEKLKAPYIAYATSNGQKPDDLELRKWVRDTLREQIILKTEADRENLTVDEFIKKIKKTKPVETQTLRDYYKAHKDEFINPPKVHAHHILISRESQKNPIEIILQLENLRSKILHKEISWDDAASKYSSCTNGSDLGYFERGIMEETFENVAFSLKIDEISNVVETPFGWHLIRVTDICPEEPALFEECTDSIKKFFEEKNLEAFLDEKLSTYND